MNVRLGVLLLVSLTLAACVHVGPKPKRNNTSTVMCTTQDGRRQLYVSDAQGRFPACAPQASGYQLIDLSCGSQNPVPNKVPANCMLALP